MFANLCFQVLDYFNITSNETVKMMIAVFLALLVFGVFYFVVKFTGLEINNLNQNILALLTVDIISFAYLMYKRKQELEIKIKEEALKEDALKESQPLDPSQNQHVEEVVEQPIEQVTEEKQTEEEVKLPQNIEEKIKEIIEEENASKEQ